MDKIYANNKKAYFDYEIIDSVEAGIVLIGQEVKATRNNRMNLNGSYATFHNGELFLINSSIAKYQPKNQSADYIEDRSRKLLLSKKQLEKMFVLTKEKRVTLIPLKAYPKNGKIKILLGVGKGKKNYDKRESLKQKDQKKHLREWI